MQKPTHIISEEKAAPRPRTNEQQEELRKLICWMEEHGAGFEEARADIERWRSSIHFDIEQERRRIQAREARQRAAAARE